ncbi:oxaloacetate decarboxylase [Chloroflexota bacterium]
MKLRELIAKEDIIITPGAYDVVSAQIIEKVGFPAVYITGLGNEASDLGYPDMGLANAVEVIRRAGNVAQSVSIPIVCDSDTGYGGVMNIYRTIQMFEATGISGVHIEDQTFPKRCGLLSGKGVIPAEDFARRVRLAADARKSKDFLIIARTDAKALLGIDEAIKRLNLYAENGADMVMVGDFYTFEEYKRIAKEVKLPLVAVAADPEHYSDQPDFSIDEWKRTGVKMVLYWYIPLFSAMKAVYRALKTFKDSGTTKQIIDDMFTYGEYSEVVGLQKWLEIDEKYS